MHSVKITRKAPSWSARTGLTLISVLALAGLGTAAHAATSRSAPAAARVATVNVKSSASPHPGWQAYYTYSVPAGTPGLFFHYACPAGLTAVSGSFRLPGSDPSEATINLVNDSSIASGSRQFGEWGWSFVWSGGTAPAGSHIVFDVYCLAPARG
jgi:hypothetical protein